MAEKEEWRPVAEFPENYEVSNLGNVRNKKTKRVLVTNTLSGYLHVNFSIEGKSASRKVHRLVGEAFLKNPEKKPQINHKDKNRCNNKVENMEWCTQEENCEHRNETTAVAPSNNQTLKTKQIDIVTGAVLGEFNSILEAAQWVVENGLAKTVASAQSSIGNCARGKTKKSYEYRWEIDRGESKEGEEWKVLIHNGVASSNYFVSNLGRFKNYKGVIMENYKAHASKDIFVRSDLGKLPLHRLVAEAFVPNPENKPNVIHINGDSLDLRAVNLKWTTAKETATDNRASGKNPGFKRAILAFNTETKETKRYKTMKEFSEECNISYSCVKEALKKTLPKTKNFLLQYDESNKEDESDAESLGENEILDK